MAISGVGELPVLKGSKLMGTVSLTDIASLIYRHEAQLNPDPTRQVGKVWVTQKSHLVKPKNLMMLLLCVDGHTAQSRTISTLSCHAKAYLLIRPLTRLLSTSM